MQTLTEADRDSQRNAGSCIEMHRQLGRQRETDRDRERDRDRQRQTETDRDRQRQTERDTETGRDRQRQTETEIHTEIHTGRYRYICREGHLEAKSYIQAVPYRPI